MTKGILIDLGDTIVYNNILDFNNGLKRIYHLAKSPKSEFEELININTLFKYATYDNKVQIEITCQNYLRYLIHYCHLDFDLSIEELEKEFALACEYMTLVPKIEKILSFCYDHKIKIIILSNSMFSKAALLKQMESLHISHYFMEILSSADYILRKPHSLFFELGIKCLACKKEEVLYIGNDYQYDILAANKIGLNICWFNEYHLVNINNINCLDISDYEELLSY